MRLADDIAMSVDPVALMRATGVEPDPWQSEVLRSTHQRILLNWARQVGKGATMVTLAVHTAAFDPGATVLIVSASQRQASDMLRRCKIAYRALGRPMPTESDSATVLSLESGGRIVSLPASEGTVRGFDAVRLLIVDEASRVPDEVWSAITPTVAVGGGRIVAASTPNGRRGWWYEALEADDSTWLRSTVKASQCPRIPQSFLDEERARMSPAEYASEYECTPGALAASLFDDETIDRMFSANVAPLDLSHRKLIPT